MFCIVSLTFLFKIYRLNYEGCQIETMPVNADPPIPISQNECQSHAFEAKHMYWAEGMNQNFFV